MFNNKHYSNGHEKLEPKAKMQFYVKALGENWVYSLFCMINGRFCVMPMMDVALKVVRNSPHRA